MKENLVDLDCIIKPVAMMNHVVNAINPTESIIYPEEFMVMEHAVYGSLHELVQYTKNFNEISAFAVF